MVTVDLNYLAENLAQVRHQVTEAAQRAGRSSSEITLVGVSKTVGRSEVAEMGRLGLADFGENRIADAEAKFVPSPFEFEYKGKATGKGEDEAGDIQTNKQPTLHLIGHLQTNKAKRAVALFDLVHSVDSLHLAQTLAKQAEIAGKKLPILLQVNVSGEESKEGLTPAELPAVLEKVLQLVQLEPRGLMTIAPNFPDPAQTRPVFQDLRRLFENYRQVGPHWSELSMGMTNDFEVAIEEGATLIRVGRALFQPGYYNKTN